MREQLQQILDESNGRIMRDSTSIDWSSFRWNNGFFTHKITKTEIMKPYYISYAYYGTTKYTDIILLLNNIMDIFEVVPETILYIPKIEDLKKFIADNKV